MGEGELPPTPGWKWVAIERPLTEAGEGGSSRRWWEGKERGKKGKNQPFLTVSLEQR